MFFQVLPPSFCTIFLSLCFIKNKMFPFEYRRYVCWDVSLRLNVDHQAVFREAAQKIKFKDRNVESRCRLLREWGWRFSSVFRIKNAYQQQSSLFHFFLSFVMPFDFIFGANINHRHVIWNETINSKCKINKQQRVKFCAMSWHKISSDARRLVAAEI